MRKETCSSDVVEPIFMDRSARERWSNKQRYSSGNCYPASTLSSSPSSLFYPSYSQRKLGKYETNRESVSPMRQSLAGSLDNDSSITVNLHVQPPLS